MTSFELKLYKQTAESERKNIESAKLVEMKMRWIVEKYPMNV